MKKFLALILSGLMLVGVLAGCGSSKTNTTTSSGSSDKVSLTWWAFPTFGTDGAYEKEVIAAFNAVHPEITIDLVTIDFTSGPDGKPLYRSILLLPQALANNLLYHLLGSAP